MKTKKRFFLKAAGISPVKGAGISLALVMMFAMMFAMAFAACDTGTSSSGKKTETEDNGTNEAPQSRIFKSDANGTVELTITEILSASTQTADSQTADSQTADSQTADSQTADSQTVYSVAAPTSGEVFYYAIRVKGYSEPVSQGTVTVGTSAWTFTSRKLGISFPINVSVSGERLIFAETPIPTDDGTEVQIPQLSVTGGSKDSGPSGIPSGPSAAQQAATALAAKLGSKATVTGDGTVVTLTGNILLDAGDTLSIPADVTLYTADKKLIVETGATLTVAADGIIDLGTSGTITKNGGTVTNNGTIRTADADGSTLVTLLTASTGVTAGTVEVSGEVALPADANVEVAIGVELKVADTHSLTIPGDNNPGTLTNEGTIAFDTGSNLDVQEGESIDNAAGATIQTVDGTVLGTLLGAVDAGIVETSGTIELDASAEVKGETTLTVASGTLTIDNSAKLTVAADAKIEVANSATLVSANGSTGELNGDLEVQSGGVYKDLNPGGGTLWGGDSAEGTITWNAGAKGYVGGDAAENLRIGASTDPDTSTLVQLATGTLKNTKTGYELEGTATVRGNFGLTGSDVFHIANGTLTVDLKWQGAGRPGELTVDGVYIFGQSSITGAGSASIEVKTPSGDGSSLTGGLIYIDNDPGKNFYNNDETKLGGTDNVFGEASDTTVPAGTYVWTEDADGSGTAGWKKQE